MGSIKIKSRNVQDLLRCEKPEYNKKGKLKELICYADRNYGYCIKFTTDKHKIHLIVANRWNKPRKTKRGKLRAKGELLAELPLDWIFSEDDKKRLLLKLAELRPRVDKKTLRRQIEALAWEVGEATGQNKAKETEGLFAPPKDE